MKGSNSRLNFSAGKRFSSVMNIQGGMITDSDLVEGAEIARARDETIAAAAMHSGVPATGGMLEWREGEPFFREGLVVAEGKTGHFTTKEPLPEKAGPADAMKLQADFPDPQPALNGLNLLYADLWERAVFALMEPGMADAGLHGVETSYRTRTMVQLKSIPLSSQEPEEIRELLARHRAFSRTGTAKIRLIPRVADVEVDDCDPCADQIEVEQVTPNALFRLEVTEVERGEDGAPVRIRLAWSMENGAVIERNDADMRGAIERDGAVYQFFSEETESHQGWLAPEYRPAISQFAKKLSDAPSSGEAGGLPFIRRWDGTVEINPKARRILSAAGVEKPKLNGGVLTITTAYFSVEMRLDADEFLTGDYWLAELRRYADEADRLRLVGADKSGEAGPRGGAHHFCLLLVIDGDEAKEQPDMLRRAGSFPALSDLPAGHVSYEPPDDCPVFGNARTVEDALDRICGLSARHVHITPPPGCKTLENADNVQEALTALCAADDSKTLRLMLRTMMDWGVICGLRLSLEDPEHVRISGGVALDRTGRLEELPEMRFSLANISGDEIHGDIDKIQELAGEICLSLELVEGKEPRLHLSGPGFVFGASDRTMKERIADCLEGRETLESSGALAGLGINERVTLNRIHTAWSNRRVLGAVMRLDESQQKVAERILVAMRKEFEEGVSEAVARRLDGYLRRADEELGGDIRGEGVRAQIRRMQLMVAKFGLLAKVEAETRNECLCAAALPDCPVHDERAAALIPLGCITLNTFTPGRLSARELCDLCCRKQSHNWRSYTYYFGDQLGRVIREAKAVCCEAEADNRKIGEILDDFSEAASKTTGGSGSALWPPHPAPETRSGPDVRGLSPADAVSMLKGAGVNVDGKYHIDTSKDDVFVRLYDVLGQEDYEALRLDFQAKMGDTVGFLLSGGIVMDLFVVGQAPWEGYLDLAAAGELLSQGEGTKADFDIAVIDDLITKVDGLQIESQRLARDIELAGQAPDEAAIADMRRDISAVTARNEALARDIARLSRPADTGEITSMRKELDELKAENATLSEAREISKQEVAEMRDMLTRMEKAATGITPVETIVTAEDAEMLRKSGITTKAQLDNASAAVLRNALGRNTASVQRVTAANKEFKLLR